jgi:2-keto-4-pentenoate hydratase
MNELEAARLVWNHWQAGTTMDSLPDGLRPAERAAGYGIQARLPEVSGRTVVGWKIAATSAAGQKHIGVPGPLAGRILSGQVDPDGTAISLSGNCMRVVEAEFAFRFARDLEPGAAPYSTTQVLDAVEALFPTLEVPDSRFVEFARAGEAQLLADNACAHRFVLGRDAPVDWRSLDLQTFRVHAVLRRANGELVERDGRGSAVLGDPRVALAWLVNELVSLGVTLHAGEFVSTGTCIVPLEVRPGDQVTADFGELGSVSVQLTA